MKIFFNSTFGSSNSANSAYSHLSNKRGAHAYRFWKIPPSSFIDFLDFSTLHSSFIRFYSRVQKRIEKMVCM